MGKIPSLSWLLRNHDGFKQMRRHLDEISFLDGVLDRLLDDKKEDEHEVKAKVQTALTGIKSHILAFKKELDNDKEKLALCTATSDTHIDYHTQIENMISFLMKEIEIVDNDFHKDDFLTFVDETIQLRQRIRMQIDEWHDVLDAYNKQSKNSLEFMYDSKDRNLSKNEFKQKALALGCEWNETKGKGSHFRVRFNICELSLGPSQHNENQIASGTLNGELDRRSKNVRPYVDPKYLKCYFYKNEKDYKKLFIKLFKDTFAV